MDIVAVVALAGVVICDGITALNSVYEGTFGASDIRMLGFDALSVATMGISTGVSAWAKGLGTSAKEAGTVAKGAEAAAASARAETAAANASVAARSSRVEQLTSGNWLKVTGARVFGVTGRAQSALANSRAVLTEAQATEQAATANAALKAQEAATAASAAERAHHIDQVADRVDKAAGVAGVANTNYTETGMANPASAMVRATSSEVQHLAAWNDNPTGSAALSAGSHIQAQPIPVS
jgi:hypothetical protein